MQLVDRRVEYQFATVSHHCFVIAPLVHLALAEGYPSHVVYTNCPILSEVHPARAYSGNRERLLWFAAKEVLVPMIIDNKDPQILAEEKKLLQVSDESAIESIVSDVLAANEQAANDVKNGELKAIGFLVGQVMKQSKGQANPALAQKIIKKQLAI